MSKDVDEAKRASRFSRGCLQWLIGTYTYMCAYVDSCVQSGKKKTRNQTAVWPLCAACSTGKLY